MVIAFEVEEYTHLDHTLDASFVVDAVVVVIVASWADVVEIDYIGSAAAAVAVVLEGGASQEKE